MRSSPPVRATVVGSRVVVTLAMVLVLLGGAPAAAHTAVDFTLPTDGAVVGEPVREITVGFTDPVTLVGPGFEVLAPQGDVLIPFAATDDDRVFRLQLDRPIGGGEAAVRYEVRAEDGHTITGGFRFTITVDAPTTTTSAPTTPPSTSPPATTTTTAATTPATAVEATSSVPATAPAADTSTGGGSRAGLYAAGVVVAVVAVVALVAVRARRTRGAG